MVGQEEWLCDGSPGSLCCLIQARQPRRVGDEPCTARRLSGSGRQSFPWCHVRAGLPGDALCQIPSRVTWAHSLICSQGALFTQDMKCLPAPAVSGAHCGWYRQQAALGWYSSSAMLGGNRREQRREGGEGPAGDAEAPREHVPAAASRAHGGGSRAAATARPPRTSQVRLPACP